MTNSTNPGKRDTCRENGVLLAAVGCALALLLTGLLHKELMTSTGLPLLIAPFGASAVLVFAAEKSPLAQPRNVIGGHVFAALIGVTVYQLIGSGNELLCISLAVPLAIAVMRLTGTVHPPGGATAFLTAAGGESIHALGYWYVLTPCLAGSVLMVMAGMTVQRCRDVPHKQVVQGWCRLPVMLSLVWPRMGLGNKDTSDN